MNVPRLVLTDLVQRAKHPDFSWQPLRPGIDMHPLYGEHGEGARGPSAALLRYAPGASLPRHGHPGHEHIFVLEGSQTDDDGTYAAPSFIVNPPGSSHAVTSVDGCLVLVIWEEPVQFV